jgi:hypothetical protein
MGISEVKSPTSTGSRTRTGFGPGSNQPRSPGSGIHVQVEEPSTASEADIGK